MTNIWKHFGETTFNDLSTLAAYLEDPFYQKEMTKLHVPFPSSKDFNNDPTYNANPFSLDLPPDYVEIIFLIKSVATWGPEALINIAASSMTLEVANYHDNHNHLSEIRFRTTEAVKQYLVKTDSLNKNKVLDSCMECRATYRPYQDEPESVLAQRTWEALGAPWFAAETICANFSAVKDYGETEPPASNSTWINRCSVWPIRAAEQAAKWTFYGKVQEKFRRDLIDWVKSHR